MWQLLDNIRILQNRTDDNDFLANSNKKIFPTMSKLKENTLLLALSYLYLLINKSYVLSKRHGEIAMENK